MHTFAGNISLAPETPIDASRIPPDWKWMSMSGSDRKMLYVQGTTEMPTSTALITYVEEAIGKALTVDISHTGDPDSDIIHLYEPTHGSKYSVVAVHGEDIDAVVRDYSEKPGVASIRTAEVSKHFSGRVVKVDFIR